MHQCLKATTLNWEFLSEYEQYNLATLPVYLKGLILSYLSVFSSKDALGISTLKVLFYSDRELPGSTGAEELSQLDLTDFFSTRLTISDVTRYLSAPKGNSRLSLGVESLEIDGDQDEKSTAHALSAAQSLSAISRISSQDSEILESWEDASNSSTPPLPKSLKNFRFPHLTRLSLARADTFASWPQLLVLSQHLSTITHLSLAYWPLPTITPNSRRTFVESRHGSGGISLGGSHLYSVMDEDWYEASNILRRLSKNLYSLRWLDLEGCSEWLPALTWEGGDVGPDRWVDRSFGTRADAASDPLSAGESVTMHGPDWNGAWSQLVYVNVSQGSLPRDVTVVRRLPASVSAAELLLYLRSLDELGVGNEDDGAASRLADVAPVDIPRWLELEKQARKVSMAVRLKRSKRKGLYCRFDHGWSAEGLREKLRAKEHEAAGSEPERGQTDRARRWSRSVRLDVPAH